MKARELMRRDLTSVEPDTLIHEAIYLMEQAGLSTLPVVDEEGKLVGVITEHDLIHAALPEYFEMLHSISFLPNLNQVQKRLREMAFKPVSDYMKEALSVRLDDEDLHIADLLIRKRLKQIPVVDEEGKLVGVIRRIDILSRLVR
ncbi:CBS domain-containing protein [Candidatus Bipolaricaulota bacterium]|nr:CBS domain-containing protein [Candidatus Bipolaricaulota bacterium]